MGFKLQSDSANDRPFLVCDICGQAVLDIWNDKATGTPVSGQITDVTVHHTACTPPSGSVTIPLIDFLKLLCIQNRIGDVGSDGSVDKASVEYPMGKGFEV